MEARMSAFRLIKRIALIATVILCMAVLVACSEETEEDIPEGAIRIYCTDKNRSEIVWEYYSPSQKPGNAQITEVLNVFGRVPENALYQSAMPEGVSIDSYYFGQSGQLVLLFGEDYNKIDRLSEVLLRTCLVKTLCQLAHIDGVEFYVDGQQLMLKNDKPAGIMTSEDFIDNTGGTAMFTQSVGITVYFADATGTMLKESRLIVESNGLKPQYQLALEQLIAGPLAIQTDLYPVMPDGTAFNRINVRDGIAYVDMNAAFLNGREGISDEIVIYSIVNTLAEIPNIVKVVFTIDGQPVKAYHEIPFSDIFERRPELITTEKAGDAADQN